MCAGFCQLVARGVRPLKALVEGLDIDETAVVWRPSPMRRRSPLKASTSNRITLGSTAMTRYVVRELLADRGCRGEVADIDLGCRPAATWSARFQHPASICTAMLTPPHSQDTSGSQIPSACGTKCPTVCSGGTTSVRSARSCLSSSRRVHP